MHSCRHVKRYQDIEELLRAGIDVYTTVNVQHLESLNDLVSSLTGVTVNERIPDWVFDSADQVEVVDVEPDDLIARLEEGKVYRAAQAQQALGHFFSKQNLAALREIALRRTADRLNRTAESNIRRVSQPQRPYPGLSVQRPLQCKSHPYRRPNGRGLSRRFYRSLRGDSGYQGAQR